jgi:hypothetical protein
VARLGAAAGGAGRRGRAGRARQPGAAPGRRGPARARARQRRGVRAARRARRLGVGGVTEDGREYEAIGSGAIHHEDWLRLTYTNERPELAWLFVFGLQQLDGQLALREIAPLPEEGSSLPIRAGRFVPLPFEARLSSRHALGRLRLVALFTQRPLGLEVVRQAVSALDPDALVQVPSELEAALSARLALTPGDRIQVLDTAIVPGTATLPTARDPREESP